jgi:glycosyltransferase involved in cell wall biosynthesis
MKNASVYFISNTYWSLWNFRRNLIGTVSSNNHEVTLIAAKDAYHDNFKNQGVNTYSLNKPRVVSPIFFILWSISIIIWNRPKLVYSFTHLGNISAGLARKLISFKFVANLSGLGRLYSPESKNRLSRLILTFLIKFTLRSASTIFVQNNDDRKWLIELIPSKSDRIILLPGSGTDLQRFSYCEPGSINIPKTKTILMMSRLLPEKGVDWFLKAAKELSKLNLNFTLIGAKDDRHTDLLDLVKKYKDEGIIKYFGLVDDVFPSIRDAYCIVLPSRYREGTPKSLIEALAVGKPVITTDMPGCKDTIDGNGFLVNNYKEFSEALKIISNQTDEEYVEQCKNSRKLAESKFDERKVIQSYLNELR